MKTPSYAGKVAAVTGASSGIGRALCIQLARRGCEVAASDVDEAGLAATATAATGARVTTRRVDVSNRDEVYAWAEQVVRDHRRVNLVFNNAGVSYGGTVRDAPDAELRRVMEINFWGVVHGTRAFLPHLEDSGDGHVVNISSIFGIISFPGQSAYNAAKFAVRGFTESLRIELDMLGSPVTATCVDPGGVKTNIAKHARVHRLLEKLGTKLEHAQAQIEETFRLTPDEAAEVILTGAAKNEGRVLVGADAWFLDLVQRSLPVRYQQLVAWFSRRRLKAWKST